MTGAVISCFVILKLQLLLLPALSVTVRLMMLLPVPLSRAPVAGNCVTVSGAVEGSPLLMTAILLKSGTNAAQDASRLIIWLPGQVIEGGKLEAILETPLSF